MQILNDWIKSKSFPPAEWEDDKESVVIDGETYTLKAFGELN